MAITIEHISGVKNQLGEGPVWDVTEKVLYWIDGHAPAIYRLEPKTNEIKSWKVPKPIGSFALREKGGAICAMSDGFYFLILPQAMQRRCLTESLRMRELTLTMARPMRAAGSSLAPWMRNSPTRSARSIASIVH